MVELIPEKLPRHVAVIMDGNGRWAKKKAMNRIRGHEEGAESVREIVRASREIGISWLTLYAFSEENWRRPRYEIGALMKLLKHFLKSELNEMLENGIRLQTIGRTHKLLKTYKGAIRDHEPNSVQQGYGPDPGLSYGGRQEITDGLQRIAGKRSRI
jgi:undecaprenyl diphosphate synthase